MIKAVIFDMDGLMFDTEKLWEDTFFKVGNQFGYYLSADFHRSTIGTNYTAIEKTFKDKFGSDFPFADFYVECRKYMDEIIRNNGLGIKKGLLELLNYLKENNYLIAIGSSSKLKRIKWYLECAGIAENMFTAIVSGDDIVKGKPNPDIFLKACELLLVNPSETLVLEDSNNGIKAAKNAGCISVLIPDLDVIKEDVLEQVDYKFDSLYDVIDFLSR